MPTTSAASTTESISSADGVRLHFAADEVPTPRAALMFIHGFGEHCHRYDGTVARLCSRGYNCYRIDVRGHGRSEGARGHIFSFEGYLRDAAALRKEAEQRAGADLPRILVGHSNGGLIALHSVARDASGLAGLALSSPFFGLEMDAPWVKVAAARALSKLVPALGIPTGLDPTHVSHDPEVVRAYTNDPLNVTVASGRWFTETMAAQDEALARARDVKLPVLLQMAGDDRIASLPAARNVFERLGSDDRTWRVYPGLFHEIWFELEREAPLTDLEQWLADRTTAPVR